MAIGRPKYFAIDFDARQPKDLLIESFFKEGLKPKLLRNFTNNSNIQIIHIKMQRWNPLSIVARSDALKGQLGVCGLLLTSLPYWCSTI